MLREGAYELRIRSDALNIMCSDSRRTEEDLCKTEKACSIFEMQEFIIQERI